MIEFKTKVAVKITDKNRQKAIDLLLEYGQEFNIADSAEGFLKMARKPYQEKASVWEVIQGEPWGLKIINLTKLREILKTEEGGDPYLWGNKIVSEPRDGEDLGNAINPAHYTELRIQPVDYIETNKLDFFEGNIVKYVSRYKRKNGLEDLKKAKYYIDKIIERYEKADEKS